MKKIKGIKNFLFALLILPCLFLFTACDNSAVVAQNNYIVSIAKTDTQGLTDIYTITYSDGTTSTFTIKNGENGKDGKDGQNAPAISLEDAYTSALANGFSGTYIEFLKEYLKTDGTDKETAAANLGLMSAVCIDSSYKYTTQAYVGNPFTGYELQTVTQTASQAGSGVICTLDKSTGDAYIITNYHVVYASYLSKVLDNVKVMIYGHQSSAEAIDATYIGGSMTYDIAVLKVSGSSLLKQSDCVAVCDRFENSNNVPVGTTAIAVGNAAGLGISVTSGIVSVDSEYISMTSVDSSTTITFRTMRIDTAINGGNSGGALFDDNGNVIGIVNARITTSSIENIAYAIPSNIAKNVADNLIYNYVNGGNKHVSKFTLGITTTAQSSSTTLNSDMTVKTVEQVAISEITDESFAKSILSLEVGDIIKSIAINGTTYEINRTFEISDLCLSVRPNDTVSITYIRDGQENTKSAIASSNFFNSVV